MHVRMCVAGKVREGIFDFPSPTFSLTLIHFSTLISCRVEFLNCKVVLPHHLPHHPQLVLTWAATFHGRHNLPPKISMHHQHVIAGLCSCSISVALGEREAVESEGGQEEQTEEHLHGRQCSACVLVLCLCMNNTGYIKGTSTQCCLWVLKCLSWLRYRLQVV